MSRVLLFSDLHVFPHKRSPARITDCLDVLDWVFETARKKKVTDILFGGDLFHDRLKIDVPTYQYTFERLKKNLTGGIRLWLLLGNHDLWYAEKTCLSSVVPLSALPGIHIIHDPCRMEIAGTKWDFMPFTFNPVEALQTLSDLPGEAPYCLGHIAIHGAILHGQHQSDVIVEHDGDMVVVDAGLFQKYKHVFLGHYHAEQRIGENVEYIGSGLELSFGEAYQEKHIILLDQETGETEYIVNNFSPKHLVIHEKDLDESMDVLSRNFIKVVVDDAAASNLVEVRHKVVGSKPGSLEIKQINKRELQTGKIEDAKNILQDDQLLERYIDATGIDDLDRSVLLKIGQKICGKTP